MVHRALMPGCTLLLEHRQGGVTPANEHRHDCSHMTPAGKVTENPYFVDAKIHLALTFLRNLSSNLP